MGPSACLAALPQADASHVRKAGGLRHTAPAGPRHARSIVRARVCVCACARVCLCARVFACVGTAAGAAAAAAGAAAIGAAAAGAGGLVGVTRSTTSIAGSCSLLPAGGDGGSFSLLQTPHIG